MHILCYLGCFSTGSPYLVNRINDGVLKSSLLFILVTQCIATHLILYAPSKCILALNLGLFIPWRMMMENVYVLPLASVFAPNCCYREDFYFCSLGIEAQLDSNEKFCIYFLIFSTHLLPLRLV